MKRNKKCHYCNGKTKKNGIQRKTGKQTYRCLESHCGKYMQDAYVYQAKSPKTWELFTRLNKLNVPIRKLGKEVLQIDEKTVSKWILKALNIIPVYQFISGNNYEMDELHTYVQNKNNKVCVAYAYNTTTRLPIGLHVGGWSTKELAQVADQVLLYNPKQVKTDGLKQYKKLFKDVMHKTGRHITNHIERQNLNLRKDIPHLTRDTICYAKNIEMLKARIMWYFWGENDPYFFLKK